MYQTQIRRNTSDYRRQSYLRCHCPTCTMCSPNLLLLLLSYSLVLKPERMCVHIAIGAAKLITANASEAIHSSCPYKSKLIASEAPVRTYASCVIHEKTNNVKSEIRGNQYNIETEHTQTDLKQYISPSELTRVQQPLPHPTIRILRIATVSLLPPFHFLPST